MKNKKLKLIAWGFVGIMLLSGFGVLAEYHLPYYNNGGNNRSPPIKTIINSPTAIVGSTTNTVYANGTLNGYYNDGTIASGSPTITATEATTKQSMKFSISPAWTATVYESVTGSVTTWATTLSLGSFQYWAGSSLTVSAFTLPIPTYNSGTAYYYSLASGSSLTFYAGSTEINDTCASISYVGSSSSLPLLQIGTNFIPSISTGYYSFSVHVLIADSGNAYPYSMNGNIFTNSTTNSNFIVFESLPIDESAVPFATGWTYSGVSPVTESWTNPSNATAYDFTQSVPSGVSSNRASGDYTSSLFDSVTYTVTDVNKPSYSISYSVETTVETASKSIAYTSSQNPTQSGNEWASTISYTVDSIGSWINGATVDGTTWSTSASWTNAHIKSMGYSGIAQDTMVISGHKADTIDNPDGAYQSLSDSATVNFNTAISYTVDEYLNAYPVYDSSAVKWTGTNDNAELWFNASSEIQNESMTISVNWGDGNILGYSSSTTYNVNYGWTEYHQYSNVGVYTISVTLYNTPNPTNNYVSTLTNSAKTYTYTVAITPTLYNSVGNVVLSSGSVLQSQADLYLKFTTTNDIVGTISVYENDGGGNVEFVTPTTFNSATGTLSGIEPSYAGSFAFTLTFKFDGANDTVSYQFSAPYYPTNHSSYVTLYYSNTASTVATSTYKTLQVHYWDYNSASAYKANLTEWVYQYDIPNNGSDYIRVNYNSSWLYYSASVPVYGAVNNSNGSAVLDSAGWQTIQISLLEPIDIANPLGNMLISYVPSSAIGQVAGINIPFSELTTYVKAYSTNTTVQLATDQYQYIIGNTYEITTKDIFNKTIYQTNITPNTSIEDIAAQINFAQLTLSNLNSTYFVSVYIEQGGITQALTNVMPLQTWQGYIPAGIYNLTYYFTGVYGGISTPSKTTDANFSVSGLAVYYWNGNLFYGLSSQITTVQKNITSLNNTINISINGENSSITSFLTKINLDINANNSDITSLITNVSSVQNVMDVLIHNININETTRYNIINDVLTHLNITQTTYFNLTNDTLHGMNLTSTQYFNLLNDTLYNFQLNMTTKMNFINDLINQTGYVDGYYPITLTNTPQEGQVPITITNSQSNATGTYQQLINFPTATYKNSINSQFSDVYFAYANGTTIPAWIQSNASNTYTTTPIWMKLNSVPASSSITVYAHIVPNSVFFGQAWANIGEADTPNDNGKSVFPAYISANGNGVTTRTFNGETYAMAQYNSTNLEGIGNISGTSIVSTFLGVNLYDGGSTAGYDLLTPITNTNRGGLFLATNSFRSRSTAGWTSGFWDNGGQLLGNGPSNYNYYTLLISSYSNLTWWGADTYANTTTSLYSNVTLDNLNKQPFYEQNMSGQGFTGQAQIVGNFYYAYIFVRNAPNDVYAMPSAIVSTTMQSSNDTQQYYQQLITINDPSQYDLNSNYSNFQVVDSSYNPVYAWIQDYNSTSLDLWVKVPYPVANTTKLYLHVFSKSNFELSSTGYIGEAPQLSSVYGQNDNGHIVFSGSPLDFYTNFTNTDGLDDIVRATISNGLQEYGYNSSTGSDSQVYAGVTANVTFYSSYMSASISYFANATNQPLVFQKGNGGLVGNVGSNGESSVQSQVYPNQGNSFLNIYSGNVYNFGIWATLTGSIFNQYVSVNGITGVFSEPSPAFPDNVQTVIRDNFHAFDFFNIPTYTMPTTTISPIASWHNTSAFINIETMVNFLQDTLNNVNLNITTKLNFIDNLMNNTNFSIQQRFNLVGDEISHLNLNISSYYSLTHSAIQDLNLNVSQNFTLTNDAIKNTNISIQTKLTILNNTINTIHSLTDSLITNIGLVNSTVNTIETIDKTDFLSLNSTIKTDFTEMVNNETFLNSTVKNVNISLQSRLTFLQSLIDNQTLTIKNEAKYTNDTINSDTTNIEAILNFANSTISKVNVNLTQKITLVQTIISNLNINLTTRMKYADNLINSTTTNITLDIGYVNDTINTIKSLNININTNITAMRSVIDTIETIDKTNFTLLNSTVTNNYNSLILNITFIKSLAGNINTNLTTKISAVDSLINSQTTSIEAKVEIVNSTLDVLNTNVTAKLKFVDSLINSTNTSIILNMGYINDTINYIKSLSITVNTNLSTVDSVVGTIKLIDTSDFAFLNTTIDNQYNSLINNETFIKSVVDNVNTNVTTKIKFTNSLINSTETSIFTKIDIVKSMLNSTNINITTKLKYADNLINNTSSSIVLDIGYENDTINYIKSLDLSVNTNITVINGTINAIKSIDKTDFSLLNTTVKNNYVSLIDNITTVDSIVKNVNVSIVSRTSFVDSLINSSIVSIKSKVNYTNSLINSTTSNIKVVDSIINDTVHNLNLNFTTQIDIVQSIIKNQNVNISSKFNITNSLISNQTVSIEDKISFVNDTINFIKSLNIKISTNLTIVNGTINTIKTIESTDFQLLNTTVKNNYISLINNITAMDSIVKNVNVSLVSRTSFVDSLINSTNTTILVKTKYIDSLVNSTSSNITVALGFVNSTLKNVNLNLTTKIDTVESILNNVNLSVTSKIYFADNLINNTETAIELRIGYANDTINYIKSLDISLNTNITIVNSTINTIKTIDKTDFTDINDTIRNNYVSLIDNITTIKSIIDNENVNITTRVNFVDSLINTSYTNISTKIIYTNNLINTTTTHINVVESIINSTVKNLNLNFTAQIKILKSILNNTNLNFTTKFKVADNLINSTNISIASKIGFVNDTINYIKSLSISLNTNLTIINGTIGVIKTIETTDFSLLNTTVKDNFVSIINNFTLIKSIVANENLNITVRTSFVDSLINSSRVTISSKVNYTDSLINTTTTHINVVESIINSTLHNFNLNFTTQIAIVKSIITDQNINISDKFNITNSLINNQTISIEARISFMNDTINYIKSLTISVNSNITVVDGVVNTIESIDKSNFTLINSTLKNNYISILNNISLVKSIADNINLNLTAKVSAIDSIVSNLNTNLTTKINAVKDLINATSTNISLEDSIINSTLNSVNLNVTTKFNIVYSEIRDFNANASTDFNLLNASLKSLNFTDVQKFDLIESLIGSLNINETTYFTSLNSSIHNLNLSEKQYFNLINATVNNFNLSITTKVDLIDSLLKTVNVNETSDFNIIDSVLQSANFNASLRYNVIKSSIGNLSFNETQYFTLLNDTIHKFNLTLTQKISILNSTINEINANVSLDFAILKSIIGTANLNINQSLIFNKNTVNELTIEYESLLAIHDYLLSNGTGYINTGDGTVYAYSNILDPQEIVSATDYSNLTTNKTVIWLGNPINNTFTNIVVLDNPDIQIYWNGIYNGTFSVLYYNLTLGETLVQRVNYTTDSSYFLISLNPTYLQDGYSVKLLFNYTGKGTTATKATFDSEISWEAQIVDVWSLTGGTYSLNMVVPGDKGYYGNANLATMGGAFMNTTREIATITQGFPSGLSVNLSSISVFDVNDNYYLTNGVNYGVSSTGVSFTRDNYTSDTYHITFTLQTSQVSYKLIQIALGSQTTTSLNGISYYMRSGSYENNLSYTLNANLYLTFPEGVQFSGVVVSINGQVITASDISVAGNVVQVSGISIKSLETIVVDVYYHTQPLSAQSEFSWLFISLFAGTPISYWLIILLGSMVVFSIGLDTSRGKSKRGRRGILLGGYATFLLFWIILFLLNIQGLI